MLMGAGQVLTLSPIIAGMRSGEENPVVPATDIAAKVKTTGQFDCIVSLDEKQG